MTGFANIRHSALFPIMHVVPYDIQMGLTSLHVCYLDLKTRLKIN